MSKPMGPWVAMYSDNRPAYGSYRHRSFLAPMPHSATFSAVSSSVVKHVKRNKTI
jgi:hypothetical protein